MRNNVNEIPQNETILPNSNENDSVKTNINVPITTPPNETYGYLPSSYKDRWLRGLSEIDLRDISCKDSIVLQILLLVCTTVFGIALGNLLAGFYKDFEDISKFNKELKWIVGWGLISIILLIACFFLYLFIERKKNISKCFSKERFILKDIKTEIKSIPTKLKE